PGAATHNWVISPANGACSIANGVLTCAFGTLASNNSTGVHVSSLTSVLNCAAYQDTGMAQASNASAVQASAGIMVICPVLSVAKSHIGNFTQGQPSAAFSIVVSNSGPAVTTAGRVTVTEAPQAGLTLTAISGDGWSCSVPAATCMRSDSLAAGMSYPAITAKFA